MEDGIIQSYTLREIRTGRPYLGDRSNIDELKPKKKLGRKDAPRLKVCARCLDLLPEEMFSHCKGSKDGLFSSCILCVKERNDSIKKSVCVRSNLEKDSRSMTLKNQETDRASGLDSEKNGGIFFGETKIIKK